MPCWLILSDWCGIQDILSCSLSSRKVLPGPIMHAGSMSMWLLLSEGLKRYHTLPCRLLLSRKFVLAH